MSVINSSASSRPNVLLVNVDHWPGQLFGMAGHSHILTPSLDQTARAGIFFSNAYSANPVCIPARRSLMTGTTSQTHGDRNFTENLRMDPRLKTMPQAFRDHGYQAYGVGKLHVFPQRDRIGFDDVFLNEEGRHQFGGGLDDYELYLKHEGYAGQEFVHGLGNNDYEVRSWHLPEHTHPTYWTTREMCQVIQRRDPTRPGFWYCSYITPHPPIAPLEFYFDLYKDLGVDEPFMGDWAKDFDALPCALRTYIQNRHGMTSDEIRIARMGFYAQCTHIDHQFRLLIGTLREEKLLDNTIVLFTSDHGDMLGNHGMWAKSIFLEGSTKIPMILMPTAHCQRTHPNLIDNRLVELRDIMPTLLDLCGLPIPPTVEGISMVSDKKRDHLFGELYEVDRGNPLHGEGEYASRMVRDDRYKLIWYPMGNRFQLFDLKEDPREMRDLSAEIGLQPVRNRLMDLMIPHLHGADLKWVKDGKLVGYPEKEPVINVHRCSNRQRGWR